MIFPDGITDIHTHAGPLRPDAVVCVDPVDADALPAGDGWLSVGIHPWNAALATPEVWARLEAWLADPRVVAVGEVGFDRLRGPALDVQTPVFRRQAEMAAARGLPLVIHCVRATDLLLHERKKYKGIWILHGFRGKAAAARQLLDAGIDLSYGARYDEAAYAATPPSRRWRETD